MIDNATGLISIAKELDVISVGFYALTVRVTDNGFPPLSAAALVRISLMLSEFSKPKFSQKEYQAEVKLEAMKLKKMIVSDRVGGLGERDG